MFKPGTIYPLVRTYFERCHRPEAEVWLTEIRVLATCERQTWWIEPMIAPGVAHQAIDIRIPMSRDAQGGIYTSDECARFFVSCFGKLGRDLTLAEVRGEEGALIELHRVRLDLQSTIKGDQGVDGDTIWVRRQYGGGYVGIRVMPLWGYAATARCEDGREVTHGIGISLSSAVDWAVRALQDRGHF